MAMWPMPWAIWRYSRTVPVPHDAREPVQYVFSDGARKLGVLTDCGSLTAHVAAMLDGCDGLVLECNHDESMLAASDYPPALKRRISGRLGHLSNEAAAGLLAQVNVSRLQHLVAAHLSEQNNQPALAVTALATCWVYQASGSGGDAGFRFRLAPDFELRGQKHWQIKADPKVGFRCAGRITWPGRRERRSGGSGRSGGAAGAAVSAGLAASAGQQRCRRQQPGSGFSSRGGAAAGAGQQPEPEQQWGRSRGSGFFFCHRRRRRRRAGQQRGESASVNSLSILEKTHRSSQDAARLRNRTDGNLAWIKARMLRCGMRIECDFVKARPLLH